MGIDVADGYKSGCQITRRITEQWGAEQLYCASCQSESLSREPCNTRAVDFRCPQCSVGYQLKAGRSWNETRIRDAGYDAMMRAVASDAVPNLLIMQYTPHWHVKNLLLVPSFFFNTSAIERRNPLSATARRAGWVGCDILLSAIPNVGKLDLVRDGVPSEPAVVRQHYERVRPLSAIGSKLRGWTLDVLRVVQELNRREFTLADVYEGESTLSKLHPENRNVRPKIRQRLQVLRDLGLLQFKGAGCYRLLV